MVYGAVPRRGILWRSTDNYWHKHARAQRIAMQFVGARGRLSVLLSEPPEIEDELRSVARGEAASGGVLEELVAESAREPDDDHRSGPANTYMPHP